MSCNNWAAGTIKIPAKAWPGLKEGLRQTWNAEQDRKLALAGELRAALLKLALNQRNFDWAKAVQDEMSRRARADRQADDQIWDRLNEAMNAILPYERRKLTGQPGTPLSPARSMFPHATGATKRFSFGEAGISLDETGRQVTWSTGENNHAVERAEAHPMSQTLLRLLNRIEWTPGSGGTIVGNDEYNRDARHEGGGGNYVTHSYGPTSKSASASLRQMRIARTATRRW
jgi:hypothetical protein